MSDTPDLFECRLVGYSKQSRKDGDWVEVRFHIHPNDLTPALAEAPLKTVFMVAATPAEKQPKAKRKTYEDISSQRIKAKRKWEDIPLPEQAGIRCQDETFYEWLRERSNAGSWHPRDDATDKQHWAKQHIRLAFNVTSRSELSPDNEAGQKWMRLDEEYRRSHGLVTEEH